MPGRAGRLVDLQDHLAPDHRIGEFGRRRFRRLKGRDHFAAPHHRDAVGKRHDFAQLVGDEDDGLLLALQHAQHFEKLIGLGGGEHRGRFVEHQNLGAAHQRLEDFDALLQADREFADDRIGVDIERVFLAEPRQLFANSSRALGEQRPALGAEHHVLQHGQRGNEHEVLMHHAYAAIDRFARTADAHRLAVDADLAGVGLVEAIEDRHQRRLAGPVLADDAVNDALGDLEVHVLVGVNGPETLIDANQFDGGGFGLLRQTRLPPENSGRR